MRDYSGELLTQALEYFYRVSVAGARGEACHRGDGHDPEGEPAGELLREERLPCRTAAAHRLLLQSRASDDHHRPGHSGGVYLPNPDRRLNICSEDAGFHSCFYRLRSENNKNCDRS